MEKGVYDYSLRTNHINAVAQIVSSPLLCCFIPGNKPIYFLETRGFSPWHMFCCLKCTENYYIIIVSNIQQQFLMQHMSWLIVCHCGIQFKSFWWTIWSLGYYERVYESTELGSRVWCEYFKPHLPPLLDNAAPSHRFSLHTPVPVEEFR